MIDDLLVVEGAGGARRVRLDDYLEPAASERALVAEYNWIKQLRHLQLDGQTFRRRFTLRGDSLWWFAELYLHKQQVMLEVFRTIAALETVYTREQPRALRVEHGGAILRAILPQFAQKRGIRYQHAGSRAADRFRTVRLKLRARALTSASQLSRIRGASASTPARPVTVAAFVHRAFWRSSAAEGSAESYIGPVLAELQARISDRIAYVGVGPSENFRARRWWHPVVKSDDGSPVIPIESFAPLSKLTGSSEIWRQRHRMLQALLSSAEMRQHSRIEGYECWPIVREELTGIAFLQWPWSARAMDEAAAALDALRPDAVVTYAEAGGWGRALILEARRRRIPTVGLQHGFIYHSWLNYLHEDDEMRPDPAHPPDRGFPAPARTLLFDDYARSHLEHRGRFSAESLVVTGSPRLDALVRSVTELAPGEVASARQMAGAGNARDLVLFVAKYSQAKHVLSGLVEAIARMPNVQLTIKTHPAETADAYSSLFQECREKSLDPGAIKVLPAAVPLGPLLRASRLVVTVNSTVALDAGVLGIPALVIGLPNNLSPFVAAGIMAGAATRTDIEPALRRILYDEGFRQQLERARDEYFRRFAIGSDGRAAARSADAVLALAGD